MAEQQNTLISIIRQCYLIYILVLGVVTSQRRYDYIIVGAGPAGLQMGYFLQQAGRDYVILERSNVSGSFFTTYPRHNKLISINKRHTGRTNSEFNLRHDWNSLLSHDPALLFRHFSRDFFPDRADMARYLETFTTRWGLNVKYSTDVVDVSPANDGGFGLTDTQNKRYYCRTLLMGTGIWKPNIPNIPGLHAETVGYEEMSTDPEDYEGKTVLILGHGNSAFEAAHAIYGSASLVHVVGRSRVRLAWETHYVGDVRGVNNELLDTYQLKSLDGILEGDLKDVRLVRRGAKVHVHLGSPARLDNFAMRRGYDIVIRCLGFKFDETIFNRSLALRMAPGTLSKYPELYPDYQSTGVPNMYVIGSAAHSLDYRRSAGGFMHGFRYTVRALHHILERRNHGTHWPVTDLYTHDLLSYVVKRINEASGLYQMFGVLCDVILISDDDTKIQYLEDYPIALLTELPAITGRSVGRHIVLCLEYGKNFSGPGKDVFYESRATSFPNHAHMSNFLHPVFYFYKTLLTGADFQNQPSDWSLPRPARLHHVVEDFLTDWSRDISHVLHLRRFLEYCIGETLRNYFAEDCFLSLLTSKNSPLYCRKYINGLSLSRSFMMLPVYEASM